MGVGIDHEDVVDAARRIAPHVRRTPILEVEGADLGLVTNVVLKLDLLQRTGSFKVRGAFNALIEDDDADTPVVAASGGNFGLGVAFAAAQIGRHATIFVTASTPAAKLQRIRACGASVEIVGTVYADALAAAEDRAAATGALALHAYDQPAVAAGQGTCGLELAAQAGPLDTVLVAVGGGGLLAGVAAALPETTKLVAVETATTSSLAGALAAGHPIDVEVSGVAVDSLGAARIGALGFHAATTRRTESVLVGDEEVTEAQRRLWEAARLSAEPGGAAAVAALAGAYVPAPGERVAAIVCGGNTAAPASRSPAAM